MTAINQNIASHYHQEGLFDRIVNALKQQGISRDSATRTHIEGVDEFHVRGATVSRELAECLPMNGARVLDVGSGLGGPARMLADTYGCQVTGIDLSEAFVHCAAELSHLVGMQDQTSFVVGDAAELPFANAAFDVAWTQHVQMNIPDKGRFYSGIHRVLKPGGHFMYYDIFKDGEGPVAYPMPWASTGECSFLFQAEDMHTLLANLGMEPIRSTDQTQAGIAFFEGVFARLKASGPPPIGLHLLMGESTKTKLGNLLEHLKNGSLRLESGVYRKL